MRPFLWSLLPLVLVGCLQPTVTDPTGDTPAQQVAAASQSFGMLLSSSVSAALDQASAGGSNRALTTTTAPDLRVVPTTVLIDLATLTIAGRPAFTPGTASGTVTLTLDGSGVASWPAGTTTLYDGTVSVALNAVVLGNANGDQLRIPTGTFSYALQAQSTVTDATNWTLTSTATASVSPAFTAFLDRQGHTWSLSLSGARTEQQVTTRSRVLAGDGSVTADTRTEVRDIGGIVAGSSLTSDATLAALNYARWTVTIGGVPVTWSRNARVTTTRDLTTNATATTVNRDATFVSTTISDRTTTIGPFSARQLGSLFGATLDPNWL